MSLFFVSVQLLQLYVATGHTCAFISRVFVEIGMLLTLSAFDEVPHERLLKKFRKHGIRGK